MQAMKIIDIEKSKFLELLFDEGQTSCYTESPHGYKVSHSPKSDDLFLCINALHPTQDLAPTKEWHDQYTPRRADANVVCYRNFLIEIDDMPLEEQVDYVTSCIPVSSIVYSGGKSYHFIISLEDKLETLAEYKNVAKRLHQLLDRSDSSTKNPSRLSRLPNVVRPETGKKQTLDYLGSRIKNKDLLLKLPEVEKPPVYERTEQETVSYLSPMILEACMIPDEVMNRSGINGRNAFFFWLGKRMADVNMAPEQKAKYVSMAYNNLISVAGFSFEEAAQAARVRV